MKVLLKQSNLTRRTLVGVADFPNRDLHKCHLRVFPPATYPPLSLSPSLSSPPSLHFLRSSIPTSILSDLLALWWRWRGGHLYLQPFWIHRSFLGYIHGHMKTSSCLATAAFWLYLHGRGMPGAFSSMAHDTCILSETWEILFFFFLA